MKKLIPILLLLLCACESFVGGSTTTQRPALGRPAIAPDGAFWDATVVARRGDRKAFMYTLSPRFVHRSLFPDEELADVTSQAEFDAQREEIETRLTPFEPVVNRMADRYMRHLTTVMKDRFVEVSRPRYNIDYTDSFDRAEGPNRATVTVTAHPKVASAADEQPEKFEVRFIMDGRRWLIEELDPDPLKGSFAR